MKDALVSSHSTHLVFDVLKGLSGICFSKEKKSERDENPKEGHNMDTKHARKTFCFLFGQLSP
jgi:hypothetical protein